MSYLSNQGFLEGRPSWEIAGLFLESDSITILILLFGILSGEGQTLTSQFGDYSTRLNKRSKLQKQQAITSARVIRMLMVGGKVHACFKTIYSKLRWFSSCEQYLSAAGPPPPLWGQSGWVSGHWPCGGRSAWRYWWCWEPQDCTHLTHSCLVSRERIVKLIEQQGKVQ